MLRFELFTKEPVSYLTCGNLVSENGFVHEKRILDCFVLILVQKGTLWIAQENVPWEVRPGEFFLLFPGREHYGTKPSEGELSYCWVHFHLPEEHFQIFRDRRTEGTSPARDSVLSLPEKGRLGVERRSQLLFVQLLDIARRSQYRQTLSCTYAMNLLLLELSEETQKAEEKHGSVLPAAVIEAAQWIETHYDQPLTAEELAFRLNYNPAYLTTLFKKHMGMPLLAYIRRIRIQAAKNLLVNQSLRVKQIAEMCGFQDEKRFLKLFKAQEGMTPSQYRNAFYRRSINTR